MSDKLHCSLLLVTPTTSRLMADCIVTVSKGAIKHAASGPLCALLGAAAGMQPLNLCGLHVVLMQACSQWTFGLSMLWQACSRCTTAPLAAGMQRPDH